MIYSKLLTTLYRLGFGEPAALDEDQAEALILVADGVGGFDLASFGLRHVVGRSGAPQIVRPVDWGHGWGRWHADLSDVANHRVGSRVMAEQARAWMAAHPDRPVFLVGKSGGTGIAVGALEQLPERSVAGALLLASALSPDYDLSSALRAVAGELVSFWSPLDLVILGAGTLVFGTIDRVHSVGAGLVGFREPANLDDEGRRLYAERFRQVRWSGGMMVAGHLGGHIGTDNPAFLRKYIMPLLTRAEENTGLRLPRESSEPTPASITP